MLTIARNFWSWLSGGPYASKRPPLKLTWRSYAVIGTLTYGYVVNAESFLNAAGDEGIGFVAIAYAAGWPLYWSQEVFSWIL
jgi:hypothetical protein